MSAVLAAVLVIGVVTACVGPLIYCHRSTNSDEKTGDVDEGGCESPEPTTVKIKIRRPTRDGDDASRERPGNSIGSDGNEGSLEEARANLSPVVENAQQLVAPVKPPRKRRNLLENYIGPRSADCSETTRFAESRNQLGVTNWSSESGPCGGVRRAVSARIEGNSCDYEPLANASASSGAVGVASTGPSIVGDHSPQRQPRSRLSIFPGRLKHLAKLLTRSKADAKTISWDRSAADETERATLAVPLQPRVPIGHSTMLRKNRPLDGSTSSRISARSHSLHELASREIVPSEELDRNGRDGRASCLRPSVASFTGAVDSSKESAVGEELGMSASRPRRRRRRRSRSRSRSRSSIRPGRASLTAEAEDARCSTTRQTVRKSVSFVRLEKRPTSDGSSICDVTITGLALDRSELLELFEVADGEARSASVASTREASEISIEFAKRPRRCADAPIDLATAHVCPLKRLCRSLPERFENTTLSRFFHSERRSSRRFSDLGTTNVQARRNKTESLRANAIKVDDAIAADERSFVQAKSITDRFHEMKFARLVNFGNSNAYSGPSRTGKNVL